MSIITDLISPITGLLGKFIPDAGEKARLAQEIATLAEKQAHEIALQQIEVNKIEAQSGKLFQSGWRPFIGWTCGSAFTFHFVLEPIIIDVYVLAGNPAPVMPAFDMNSLLTVLGGLLGLGTMRTVEYVKGVMKK